MKGTPLPLRSYLARNLFTRNGLWAKVPLIQVEAQGIKYSIQTAYGVKYPCSLST